MADFRRPSRADSGAFLAFLSIPEGLNHLGSPQNTGLSPLRAGFTPTVHPPKNVIFVHFSAISADLGLLGARFAANMAEFRTRPRPIRGPFGPFGASQRAYTTSDHLKTPTYHPYGSI